MGFYDLAKTERDAVVLEMHNTITEEIISNKCIKLKEYFLDGDTYIRKNAYLILGKIYTHDKNLLSAILKTIEKFVVHENELVRQTAINAAGEIGKLNFEVVKIFFDRGLFDEHHRVRNAVIGSIKKMGEVNPEPVLKWCEKYLQHEDKEIRREICHGIELRGRTRPEDILPMLQKLEFDTTARVKNTLVHVLGQIAYKKGCLETVVTHLKTWKNAELVQKAIDEIIDVHHRYRNFSFYTQEEAKKIIKQNTLS